MTTEREPRGQSPRRGRPGSDPLRPDGGAPDSGRRQWLLGLGATGALVVLAPFGAGAARADDAAPAPVPKPKVVALEGPVPKRVLFVGNSYFYYNNSLHNHVRRLVAEADPKLGAELQFKSATIGGSPLDHHSIDHYLQPRALGNKEPFELVILQTLSGAALTAAGRERYDLTIDQFVPKIRATGAQTALYITPAYVKPHKDVDPTMLDRTATMVIDAANRVDALAIPVGEAYAAALQQRPGLALHQDYDGSHPTLAGTYLAACVVVAAVYRLSPVGNPYDYYGRLDRETVAWLQQVAADTVAGFYGRR